MNLSTQIAKHIRDVYWGGNWTSSNLEANLANVTWEQAITKVHSFNTIATLVYHMNYFVSVVIQILEGGPLDAKDKYSFDHPPIRSYTLSPGADRYYKKITRVIKNNRAAACGNSAGRLCPIAVHIQRILQSQCASTLVDLNRGKCAGTATRT